jgi:formylglycine-generating enzyme required for sulfatase activity
MINKRTQTVFFLFIILTLALSACLRPDVAAPPEVPAAPPVPPAVPAAPVPPPTPSLTATPASPELPFYQFVPGGQFTMGSKPDDPLAKEDEFPKHDVRLPGYWIFTNEVTNELYAECVAAGKCTPPATAETGPKSHYNDPAFKNFPVVGVVWNQADTFCKAQDAHLPTEAEWEKAARGFFGNTYPWGAAEADCKLANINGCVKDTAKVASYTDGKSPFEVRDMAGNVREWVSDWYQADAYQTAILFMPNGPETGKMKVVRGGSYLDSARDSRSSARFAYDPEREFDDVGFRCVPNTQTYSPFCSTSYKHYCSPPQTGKTPPGDCTPGVPTTGSGKTSVGIECVNGKSTVKINTDETFATLGVSINGVNISCDSMDGHTFTCEWYLQPGSAVTVKVCFNMSSDAFNPAFGLHMTSCESYNLVASIGDTTTTQEKDKNPYFLAGLAFIPSKMPLNGGGCFEGTTWDPQQQKCVKDTLPIKPPPGTEGMCMEGYVLDPNLLCCVPGTEDNGGCEPGYYHSVAADLCIPIEQNGCPAGWIYDPYLGCMQPVHQGEEPKGCPDGTHLLPDGKTCAVDSQEGNLHVTCPPGQSYVDGKGCVPGDIGTPPVQCKNGYYYDYGLQICVALNQDGCSAGTYFDPELKQCLPLTGTWTGCPTNYILNPKNGCCVPIPGTDNTDCLGGTDGQGPTPIPGTAGPNQGGYDPGSSGCPPPIQMVCDPGYHSSPDGTACLPNEGCPPGTGPTPNNPNGCFPKETEPCPDGYEMSNTGLGCVLIMADGIQHQCIPSQYWDPYMGMCLDRTDDCCAQGYYYDPVAKMCLPFVPNNNCPPGWTWNGSECTFWTPGPSCIDFNVTAPNCIEGCTSGTHWDNDQKKCVDDNPCKGVVCSLSNCPTNCCVSYSLPSGAKACKKK